MRQPHGAQGRRPESMSRTASRAGAGAEYGSGLGRRAVELGQAPGCGRLHPARFGRGKPDLVAAVENGVRHEAAQGSAQHRLRRAVVVDQQLGRETAGDLGQRHIEERHARLDRERHGVAVLVAQQPRQHLALEARLQAIEQGEAARPSGCAARRPARGRKPARIDQRSRGRARASARRVRARATGQVEARQRVIERGRQLDARQARDPRENTGSPQRLAGGDAGRRPARRDRSDSPRTTRRRPGRRAAP